MMKTGRIRISLVVPESAVNRTGNRCTTWQWATILESFGHEVVIGENTVDTDSDFMIALHASRSHDAIRRFREARPGGRLIVALTGSDIYPEPDEKVQDSIERADRLVVLQRKAFEQIPAAHREKARVIIQSAERISEARADESRFDICVVGHLRDVKDPMRTAEASRLLPSDSKIRILHAGGIHESRYLGLAEREMRENPRYQWLGELGEHDVADLIASSRLMVVSSLFEGGARVVGEAIVHGTPVVSSRIDGVIGLLGDDYPGYFSPGDTDELANLLVRFESDPVFSNALRQTAIEFAPQFEPDRERAAWKSLITELSR